MNALPQHIAQQVIVPAYVWNDADQRRGLVVKCAQTLLARLARDQLTLVGSIEDATIVPTFLQAQVGEADGVRFVAYELCEAGMADLVFVLISVPVELT